MNILVFFFPATAEEEAVLLTEQDGRALPSRLIDELGAVAGAEILAVSDRPAVLEVVRRGRRPCATLEAARPEAFERSPLDGLRALAALARSRGAVPPDAALVFVDMRNVYLSAPEIRKAWDAFRENRARLFVSLAPAKDNPIQLEAGYSIEDVGAVAFFDPAPGVAEQALASLREQSGDPDLADCDPVLTYSVPVFWEDFGRLPPPGQWSCLIYSPMKVLRPYMIPADGRPGVARRQAHLLGDYLCETPETGRLLLDRKKLGPEASAVSGLPLTFSPGRPAAACLRREGRLLLCLDSALPTQDARLRVWRIGRDGDVRSALEVFPAGPLALPGVVVADSSLTPWLEMEDDPETAGLYYSVIRRTSEADIDFTEPLCFEESLYRIDFETRYKRMESTGETFSGRQQFPPYLLHDMAITVFAADEPEGFPASLEASAIRWGVLPEPECIKVASPFDIWRYEAFRRASANPSPGART